MTISFMMDAALLVLLAATVALAFRLSFGLETFRRSRQAMDRLVSRLDANIDRAESAVAALQGAAAEQGGNLQKMIAESRHLADELRVAHENGSALAERLEVLTQKASAQFGRAVPAEEDDILILRQEEEPLRMFSIQDRDFEEEDALSEDGIPEDGEDDFDDFFTPSSLQSQAERDLFDAIQASRRQGRMVVGRA